MKKTDSFTFEEFTWRPSAVEVLLQQEGFEILLKEADLCGVSTAGTVKILPEERETGRSALMCKAGRSGGRRILNSEEGSR